MTTKVVMPQMGESIFEGTITKWLKKPGDAVLRDEPLFEISTDKVDSEIPSPATGILSQILAPEGKTVQINTVVAIINGENSEGKEEKEEALPHSQDIAAQEIHEIYEEEQSAPQEMPLAALESESEETLARPPMPEPAKPSEPLPASIAPGINIQDIRTSPLVRRLTRENNIDLSQIRGTGLEGRITKEDVLTYLSKRSAAPEVFAPSIQQEPKQKMAQQLPPAAAIAPKIAEPEQSRFYGESEIIPMTPMRKAIAEHMLLSKKTSAHVNTVFEVDMSALVRLREAQKSEFENREGIPLTYTPFFAKALIDNIREFPIFNSSVSGENIILKKPVNLGIAVALDAGLIVPVIKDAHLKSFTGLALAMHNLSERARTKKLKPEDVQNGTITMTNPGRFGALFSTPIINQPQVAILGIGGIEKRPIVIDDAIAIRSMVYLSLSFDHRVIDGAAADQFMAKLKKRLQSWTDWIE